MFTDLFLRWLNILWSWNRQLQPCLPRCLSRGIRCQTVGFLPFHRFTHDILEPKEPSSSFVTSYQPHSAVPVVFQNHNESVMRAAGILRVPTMHSGDILQQAKGDHLGRVHSDHMILEMIRQGRLFLQSCIAQWRPRVSKLALKRTVRLLLQWNSRRGSQVGDQQAKLKSYSHRESTQGESWTTL
jgi:hypothetical protein